MYSMMPSHCWLSKHVTGSNYVSLSLPRLKLRWLLCINRRLHKWSLFRHCLMTGKLHPSSFLSFSNLMARLMHNILFLMITSFYSVPGLDCSNQKPLSEPVFVLSRDVTAQKISIPSQSEECDTGCSKGHTYVLWYDIESGVNILEIVPTPIQISRWKMTCDFRAEEFST